MAFEREPVVMTWDFNPDNSGGSSFETVLDTVCDRLREKHIEYTIRRINEMDEELAVLEQELDDFIGSS